METLAFCFFVVAYLVIVLALIFENITSKQFWVVYGVLLLLATPWVGAWFILVAIGAFALAATS